MLLSYSDEKEIKDYFISKPDKRTKNTIIDYDSFIVEADQIKKSGYATDNEEFAKGIICIAVPVFDYLGKVIATIGISSLTLYDDLDSLVQGKFKLLKNVSDEISANLGY